MGPPVGLMGRKIRWEILEMEGLRRAAIETAFQNERKRLAITFRCLLVPIYLVLLPLFSRKVHHLSSKIPVIDVVHSPEPGKHVHMDITEGKDAVEVKT